MIVLLWWKRGFKSGKISNLE